MKRLIAILLLFISVSYAQDSSRVTIIIIAKATNVTAVNQWLRINIGATGDNVSVPLIGITDSDDAEPTHYGCHWQRVIMLHKNAMDKGIVNSPFVHLWQTGSFNDRIKELNLRTVPTSPLE